MKIQMLFIALMVLSSCGRPNKQEVKELVEQSYNDGYGDAKDKYHKIGMDKGFDIGFDKGEEHGIKVGVEKGKRVAKNAKIQTLVVAGIKTNIPDILIISGSLGIIIILFGVFYRLFYRRMARFISNIPKEVRWLIGAWRSGAYSLGIKKEKWTHRQKKVETKIELRRQEIIKNENHITTYKEALTKGVPETQVRIIEDGMSRFQSNIQYQEEEIQKGKDHIVEINEIENWLDVCIYNAENSSPFNEHKADLSKINDSIRAYLKDEIGHHEFDYFMNQEDWINKESLQTV